MTSEPLPPTLEALLAERAWLQSIARSLVVDSNAADDLVQEASLAALQHPPREAGSVRAWLRRVVRNVHLNRIRGDARRVVREQVQAPGTTEDPGDVVARWEVRRRIADAVLALDEPYRTTILLRFFDGLSQDEVASKMSVPAETVHTRTRRALAKLRASLGDLDGPAGRRAHTALLWLAYTNLADDIALRPLVTSPAPIGVAAMTMMTKTATGAGVLALFALAVWWVASPPKEPPKPAASAEVATAPVSAHKRAKPGEPQPDAASAEGGVPGPVDLASADRDRDLFGVVVDPDGAPVAGADLTVVRRPWRRLMLLNWKGYTAASEGAATRSASDGSFLLHLTPGESVNLRARAAGFAETEFQLLQAGERARLVLPFGVRVTVHVKDDAGAPVAGVSVEIGTGKHRGPHLGNRTATTNADGTAVLPDLPGGSTGWMFVTAGFARASIQVDELPLRGEKSIDAIVPRGRAAAGRVTDSATGQVISGARVGTDWRLIRTVTSDAGGRFELPGGIGESDDRVIAVADGFAQNWRRVEQGKDADIALTPGDAIAGRVVDATGAPIAGALVSAIAFRITGRDQETSTSSAETGEDGRFVLPSLRRDLPHGLFVMAAGRGRVSIEVPASATSQPVRDVGDVALAEGRTVRVRVIGMDGQPLARHLVSLDRLLRASASYGGTEQLMTDDLGRARFPDLGPGAYTVDVAEPAENHVRVPVEVTDRDPEPVVVNFGGDRKVRVRVVDEAGKPVPAMRVQMEFEGAPAQGLPTDADGWVAFASSVPFGRLSVFGNAEDARRFLLPESTTVPAGQSEVVVTLRRAARISGRVVDSSGTPVANAHIEARSGLTRCWSASSDADGTFVIGLPSDVTVDVVFECVYPRARDAKLTAGELRGVTPGSTGLELVLRECVRNRSFRVRVEDPTGAPVADASVLALPIGGDTYESAATGADGVARFENCADALTSIHVDTSGSGDEWAKHWARPRIASFFPEGQEVVLRLLEPAHIRGKVVDTNDKPVAGAYVDAMGGAFGANGKSSETGEFDLLVPRDEKGAFRVMVHHYVDRQEKGSATRENVRPEDGEVVIRLTPR